MSEINMHSFEIDGVVEAELLERIEAWFNDHCGYIVCFGVGDDIHGVTSEGWQWIYDGRNHNSELQDIVDAYRVEKANIRPSVGQLPLPGVLL